MTRKLVWISLVGLTIMLGLLTGCGGNGGGTSIPRTEPTIKLVQPVGVTVKNGETKQVICKAVDSISGIEVPNPQLTWTVDSAVGSISATGQLSAVSTATSDGPITGKITITGYNQKVMCDVTVLVGDLDKLSIIKPSGVDLQKVPVGDDLTFTAEGYDHYGNRGNTRFAVYPDWSVDPASIGTITANGIFTASGTGTCTITAKVGSITDTVSITVVPPPPPPESVSIVVEDSADPLQLIVGQTLHVHLLAKFVDNSTPQRVSSSDWAVPSSIGAMTQGDPAIFTAAHPGSGLITASYLGKSAKLAVAVIPSPVSLEISYPNGYTPSHTLLGEEVTFTPIMTDSIGTRGRATRNQVEVKWAVNGDIGAIAGNTFTATKLGNGTVVATYNYTEIDTPKTLTASLAITVVKAFDGTIAFVKQDQNSNIDTLAGDGTLTALSSGNNSFGFPNWSSDGSMLAFMSQGQPLNGICTMNATGGDKRSIVANRGQDPAWKPDNSMIAFSLGQVGGGEIDLTDMNGKITRLATGLSSVPRHPTWAPDGSKLAFSISEDSGMWSGVYVINADGSSAAKRIFAGEAFYVQWSPDGSKIAFADASDIYAIAPDGSGKQRLLHASGELVDGFAWAPDSSAIVYSMRVGQSIQLYLQNLSTQQQVKLTRLANAYAIYPTWK